MFTLSVECKLSASHVLPDSPPCDRLHGHTWRIRAIWSFSALDRHGMGANFRALKEALRREVVERYDHRHLNDLVPFDDVPPTAENLAREVYSILGKRFDAGPGGRLERVEIWEGPDSMAAYSE